MIEVPGACLYFGDELFATGLAKDLGTSSLYSFGVLGIEEARFLNARLGLVSNSNSWTVVFAQGITKEAQNALLKSVEELEPRNALAFVLPRSADLLGTFLSRLITKSPVSSAQHPLRTEAAEFVAMNVAERISYAKTHDNPDLIDALESVCRSGSAQFLESLLVTKTLLRKGVLSTKMAIEHLAYLLPIKRAS